MKSSKTHRHAPYVYRRQATLGSRFNTTRSKPSVSSVRPASKLTLKRKNRSPTFTKSKKARRDIVSPGLAGRSTYSRMYLTPNVSRKGLKMYSVCNWQTTSSKAITPANLDSQGWLSMNPMLSASDINAILQVSLNQLASLSGVAAGTFAQQKAVKAVITFASQEHWLNNATIHPMYVEIYDYRTVRDAPTPPGPDNFTTTFYPGIAGEILNSVGQTNVLIPGVQPTDLSIFGHFFHITKRTKVFLAPGEHHIHKVNMSCFKQADSEVFSNATGAPQYPYLKGYTCGSFFRVLGGLTAQDTQAQPVFNLFSLKAYTMTKYKFKPATTSAPHYEIAPSGIPIVGNPEFVDTEIGEIFKQGTGFLGTVAQV